MRKFACAGMLALLWSATPSRLNAGAVEVPIVVLDVSTRSTDVDAQAFRSIVDDAVGALDKSKLSRKAGVGLSVALVRMESRVAGGAEVRCTVSAVLRDRKKGTMFAAVEGSATGQDAPPRVRALEQETLRAAVGSAIARVPEAMRATK